MRQLQTAVRYLRILWAIWPEVTKLIKHVMAMLPEEEHIPAVKHVIKEGAYMLTGDNHKVVVSTWTRARKQQVQQLEEFDLENL